MPQQVVNAVRHTPVTPSDASGTAHSSHAHPGGCFEGIPCRLDSLEEKFDNMSCALSPTGTLGSLIALNSKLVHLHALNELHAVGMLGFDSAPLRIYSSPSHLGFTTKFTASGAHFYFDEETADTDDMHGDSKFCMLGHDVWALIEHGRDMCARGISLD